MPVQVRHANPSHGNATTVPDATAFSLHPDGALLLYSTTPYTQHAIFASGHWRSAEIQLSPPQDQPPQDQLPYDPRGKRWIDAEGLADVNLASPVGPAAANLVNFLSPEAQLRDIRSLARRAYHHSYNIDGPPTPKGMLYAAGIHLVLATLDSEQNRPLDKKKGTKMRATRIPADPIYRRRLGSTEQHRQSDHRSPNRFSPTW